MSNLHARVLRLAAFDPSLQDPLLRILSADKRYARTYQGPPLESGGTSIKGRGAAPAVRRLFGKIIQPGMRVLDYGAGKYARNADYLRAEGVEVYAFDPFHGSGSDGWESGQVAGTLPSGEKFDVGFTSFVLNVVPEHVEDKIISNLAARAKKKVHITRNMDIYVSVRKAVSRGDTTVMGFFEKWFAPGDPEAQAELAAGKINDETVLRFCYFGVKTSRGFQRIPRCEDKGYSLVSNTTGFKIYLK